jgi:hypothetical protein
MSVKDILPGAMFVCALLLVVSCSRSPSSTSRLIAGIPQGSADAAPRAPVPVASADASVADGGADCHAIFDEASEERDGGERGVEQESKKPFTSGRRFPSVRLGEPALDRAVRSRLVSWCASREQLFFAAARRENRERAKDFANECTCDATHVSSALVSVACSDMANLGGAHPSWNYAGFTFAVVDGKPKELTFDDVCSAAARCKELLRKLLDTVELAHPDDDKAALAAYLGKPTFVLNPTSLRILVGEDLTGYAAHGISCDVPYGDLGPLSRLRPPPGAPTAE